MRFRMVNSSGAAVTGLVDGDFTQRRYVTESDAWDDLSGTITEGEAGWYSIPITSGEADAFGQAVAWFSDGTNEAHVTFMIDDVRDLADNAGNAANSAAASAFTATQALLIGGGTWEIQSGTTESVLQLFGGVVAPIAGELLGATIVANDGSQTSFRPSKVIAVDDVLDTVTVDPPMDTALVAGDLIMFVRTLPNLLDHPDGVDAGFSHARALRKIGAAVVANNTGSAGAGAGTQTFRNLSDTSDEFEGAYDANGNRTITHSD